MHPSPSRTINRHTQAHGFTLVEMIISVGIFLTIVMIGGSAIITLHNSNEKAHDLQLIMDNLSVVIEDMTRSIRTGTTYDCSGSSTPSPQNGTNCNQLSFQSAQQGAVQYARNGSEIHKSWTSAVSGVSYNNIPITQSGVTIDTLNFTVRGASPSDNVKAYVIMHLVGHAESGTQRTDLNLQTVITQR